ncbi:MAG: hypothetical protein H6734_12505 [Alphaproteobacteria bacterium]|nr:hypothetical protein [Alphaproteobacteria bacterium]
MSELGKPAAERLERLGDAVDTIDRALFRLARQGLIRASPATVVELEALVQTAHNAGMVRAERDLSALATTVQHYLDRDPNFRDSRFVERMTRALLRVDAARAAFARGGDPRDEKAALGEARRTYEPLDRVLHVQALGAAGWVTDSDFVGITVYLRADGRILTLSNARPVEYFGNEPRRLFRQLLSDYISISLDDLAHGAFTIERAKLAADGRLSLSSDVAVRSAPWSGKAWDGLMADRWMDAVEVLRGQARDPLDGGASGLVMLRPSAWGPVAVDEAQSTAGLVLEDGGGAKVAVRVPLRPENNLLVDNLLTLGRRADLRPAGLFGRLTAGARGLFLEPFTAVYDAPVTLGRRKKTVDEVHLGLEDIEGVKR